MPGWIGDLLYHMCETCSAEKNLDEYRGIVMIDEAARKLVAELSGVES